MRPALLLLLALVLACAGARGPVDHYYRLTTRPAVGSPTGEPVLAGILEVERFSAAGLTRDRGIVFSERADSVEVQRHRYHHWSEPPAQLVAQELARYLRASGLVERVVAPELRLDADYAVSGRIERFERVLDRDRVRVRVRLALRELASGRLIASDVYQQEAVTEGRGVRAAVAAFGVALDQIFARFSADVREGAALPATG